MKPRAKLAMLLIIGLLLWMADAVGCGTSLGQGSYTRLGPVRTEQLDVQPRQLIAQAIADHPLPRERGLALWLLGQRFQRSGQYEAALASYQEIVRTEAEVTGDLKRQMARARAHLAVQQHWNDPQLRRSAAQMDLEDGLRLYREVLRTVAAKYVDETDYRQLFAAGMINLRAAMENPTFLRHWQLEDRPVERAAFLAAAETIERRAMEDRDLSGFAARGHLRNLCQAAGRTIELPCGVVISEFIFAAAEHLDSYSAFLTEDMYREVLSDIDGRFVGFGITVVQNPAGAVIVDVIPGGPADEAGIKPGDLIVSVNGQAVAGEPLGEIVRRLQGEEGSKARVTVLRAGERLDFEVIRRSIIVPSVRTVARLGPDNSVGYIRLTVFQRSTAEELDKAIAALKEQGEMSALVLDLRGNPGGLLDSAVDVTGMFLEKGLVLTTRSRESNEVRSYTVSHWRYRHTDLPLAVLTDSNTASASEIVAGALRDHQRAVLIGERTYGKGLVQSILPLDFGRSAIYLTTARYYSPSGESFQGVGIEPHVHVAMPTTVAVPVSPLEVVPPAPGEGKPHDDTAMPATPATPSAAEPPAASQLPQRLPPSSDPVIQQAISLLTAKTTAAVANAAVDAR